MESVVLQRLLVAAVLGAVVGAERESSDQPAGLRTHLTVALGAALFGVVSTLGFTEFDQRRADTVLQADVTRVASQVAVGIGFLGAGVIFRRGDTVRNLTTAASLWVTAAIGLAAGVGDAAAAAICTGALLVGLLVFRWPRALLRDRVRRARARVQIVLAAGTEASAVTSVLEEHDGAELERLALRKHGSRVVIVADLLAPRGATLEPVLATLVRRDDVTELRGGDDGLAAAWGDPPATAEDD